MSGLVRDHFLFFLEWGSMTNFAKPSAFSRSLKSFAGTLDFFADPPPFAERSEAGVPFGDAEWSGAKGRRGSPKESVSSTKETKSQMNQAGG